jgi:hypothetical protein
VLRRGRRPVFGPADSETRPRRPSRQRIRERGDRDAGAGKGERQATHYR